MGRRSWRRRPGEEEKEEEEEERTRGGPAVQPPTPPALFIIGGWRAGTSRRGADWQTGAIKDWQTGGLASVGDRASPSTAQASELFLCSDRIQQSSRTVAENWQRRRENRSDAG